MTEIRALFRAAWLSAASYRVAMVLSLLGFIVSFVPVFFVANALQPMVADSISRESDQYFSFLILGMGVLTVLTAAMTTLPGAIAGSISSGTFEAMLSTRVTIGKLVVGLSSYPVLWSLLRAGAMLTGAALLGATIFWAQLPAALLVLLLLLTTYFTVALIAAALVLVFRTSGPLITGVITISALLGGVYYSTAAIPSWLQDLSGFVPLTYGLRAMRMLLFTGASFAEVWGDVVTLAVMTAVCLAIGLWAFHAALQHSRRAGTLAQY